MSSPVRRESDRRPRFVFLTDDHAPGPASRYAWRLDAANHRPLGRSAAVSSGLDACRAAAAAVHRAIASAELKVDRAGGYWAWRVVLESGSAVSLHRYLRRIECLRGFAQFVKVAGVADPALGVVRTFGERTLRSYGTTDRTSSENPS